jgi:hypothetical protein
MADGRHVTMTKSDAAIMMEKSAFDEISKRLVSNKRVANNVTNKPALILRRTNAVYYNTTHGVIELNALHGATQCGML